MKSMRPGHKALLHFAVISLLFSGGLAQGTAQTRYSANVVGYSDADLVGGSNLVANPLDAGNNTLSNLFAGLPSGSYFLPWDQGHRTFGPANYFTSQGGWTDGTATLSVAQGGFLWLPAPKRITFVGEPWPPICVTFPMGESVFGFMPQDSCPPCPIVDCSIYPPIDTVVEKWDRQGQHWRVYVFLGSEIGWYPDIITPTLAPDEAAIFRSPLQFSAKHLGFYKPEPVQLFRPSRVGTNFSFQFYSPFGINYSVQRSSSLSTGSWRTILDEGSAPTNSVITVTVPAGTSDAGFFRLYPLRMLEPSRAGSEFRFKFYAEQGVRYRVIRSSALSPGQWSPVLTIDGSGALVTAIDPAATATTAYYRLEY